MNQLWPKVSFIIPTYNEQGNIVRCINSIHKQQYPNSEIIVIDANSTDDTALIAMSMGARILYNDKQWAEYGVQMGVKEAKGEYIVNMSADNELKGTRWIDRVLNDFKKGVDCVWGKMLSRDDDRSINKYYALLQTEPLTWWLEQISIKKLYIWGGNSIIYRASVIKKYWDKPHYVGDNDAFQYMIEDRGLNVYYDEELYIYHHCIKGLWHWVKKWYRNHLHHYQEHKDTRNMRWIMGKWFYVKVFLWCIYVLSIIPLVLHSIVMALVDKKWEWIWHIPCSYAQCGVYLWINIKLLL